MFLCVVTVEMNDSYWLKISDICSKFIVAKLFFSPLIYPKWLLNMMSIPEYTKYLLLNKCVH